MRRVKSPKSVESAPPAAERAAGGEALGHRAGPARRSFLKMGIFGAAGVTLGVPLVRVGLWWNRRPGEGLEALSEREYEVAAAIAEAWFPPGGNPPESGRELNLAGFLDGQIAQWDVDMARVFKAGFHALDDLTIVEQRAFTPFRKHDLATRQAILTEWERSPVFPKRGLLRVYKWYLTMGLTEHPGMLDRLGIDYRCS